MADTATTTTLYKNSGSYPTLNDVLEVNDCCVFLGKGGLLHHVHSVPIYPCLHILAFGKIASLKYICLGRWIGH